MTKKQIILFGFLGALAACSASRRDYTLCDSQNTCLPGFECKKGPGDTIGKCEIIQSPKDAAADVIPLDVKADTVIPVPDVPSVTDSPVLPPETGRDTSQPDLIPDAEIPDSPVDAAIQDALLPDSLPPDTRAPDAPGSCEIDNDCRTDGGALFCVNNRCAACRTNSHCNNDAGVPFCSAVNTCVSCVASDAGCSGAVPACDKSSGSCVECIGDTDCNGANKPFCRGKACVSCSATIGGDAGNNNGACKGATPACGPLGACVECMSNADCTVSNKPICDTASNTCKPCADDAQCVTKLGANPGVCMAHQDGRCATETETIFVKNSAGCVASGTGGGYTTPFCYPANAIAAITSTKRVIVIRGTTATDVINLSGLGTSQVSVVGQDSATINSTPSSPGLSITGSTSVFVRDLSFVGTTASNVGIQAETGATLRLQRVKVQNNGKGGILLNGAAFELTDVLVSGNGPGTDAAVTWGGIYVKSLPSGAGVKTLSLVSVLNNKAPGITCALALPGTNSTVFASANSTTDITSTCAISSCAPSAAGICGSNLNP